MENSVKLHPVYSLCNTEYHVITKIRDCYRQQLMFYKTRSHQQWCCLAFKCYLVPLCSTVMMKYVFLVTFRVGLKNHIVILVEQIHKTDLALHNKPGELTWQRFYPPLWKQEVLAGLGYLYLLHVTVEGNRIWQIMWKVINFVYGFWHPSLGILTSAGSNCPVMCERS